MNRALVVTIALAGCSQGAAKIPGTLPGQAHGALQLTEAQVKSKTVATDGSPSDRTGNLTTMRYSMGGYFTATRFGAVSGAELTVGTGWLTGDAAQLDAMSEAKHFYFDNEIGGVIMPFPFSQYVTVAGDFGVGYNVDDKYTYAGGRLTLAPSRKFLLDGWYRRHFGDTPGNDDAHEDRARGVLTIRLSGTQTIQLGVDYVRGDQRTLVNGVEQGEADYLLRGRYEMLAFTLGYGEVAHAPELVGKHW